MAVVGSASERFHERTTQYDGKVWTATRSWLVKTDTWSDAEDTVSTASGLPAYGESHPNPIGATMWANTINYKQLDSDTPTAWLVTAGYTSERQLDQTNPDNDEVLISFNSEIYQEAVFEDKDNKAIMNSANDPFDPPGFMIDNNQLIATITSNHQAIPTFILSYQNAVNSAGFTISGLQIGQGLAKVARITVSTRQLRGTSYFYTLSTEIHIKKDGWRLRPLDEGLHENLLGKKRKILLGKDLEPATTPQPLDGNGLFDEDATPATAFYLNFRVHDELDFTALPGIT